jgi:hypothetical protein
MVYEASLEEWNALMFRRQDGNLLGMFATFRAGKCTDAHHCSAT